MSSVAAGSSADRATTPAGVGRCTSWGRRANRQPGARCAAWPYVFVTDGPEAALARAKDAAGSQDVLINGGADVARQYLHAGLVDEIRLHVVPLVLGAGTALFEGVRTDLRLDPVEAIGTPQVTHLTYAVERPDR